MSKKTKRRILIIASSSFLLLVALVLAGLVYLKLFGLKTALEELVAVETNYEYQLTIGRANVEISTLSFDFDSLVITRNDSLPASGIRHVNVPSLQLQVANLGSMFRSAKYEIKTLIIDEPFIGIDNNAKTDTAQFHLGQQVVRLYPAIESVLERFKIEHLKINRAALGVTNKTRPPLNLRLVDFLMEEWNVARIDDDSQLVLEIGQQELNLEKSIFGFSAIEYNLQKRQLKIEDLTFSTIDSLSKSKVHLKAELLLLDKLGYLDLFEHQRLTYEKVSIQNPNINLKLNLKEQNTSLASETNEKEVITRIIKQAVGECTIDTLDISQASVKTVLKRDKDSTVIELPRIDFVLYTFKVTAENEHFETGEAEIELDKTTIALTDGINISCQKLFFDRQSNLTFEDVDLYDSANRLNVVKCRSLKLKQFKLLPLIFDRELEIESISINDAQIIVPPENLFGSGGENQQGGLKNIVINSVKLNNVAMKYGNEDAEIDATGVSLNLKNISKTQGGKFNYSFHDINIKEADLTLLKNPATIQIMRFAFNNDSIYAGNVYLNKDELDINLAGVAAKHKGTMTRFSEIGYTNWHNIACEKLDIAGTLPEQKKPAAHRDSTTQNDTLRAEQITIRSAVADLVHSKFNLQTTGKNLLVSDFWLFNGKVDYEHITGQLAKLKIIADQNNIEVNRVQLNLPNELEADGLFLKKGTLSASAKQAHILSPENANNTWSFPHIALQEISTKLGNTNVFTSDSILAENINLIEGQKPHLTMLEIFKPLIQLPPKDSAHKKKKPNLDFLEVVDEVKLEAGKLILPDSSELAFGDIDIYSPARQFSCSYLFYNLPKINIRAMRFAINPEKLTLDTLLLRPNENWGDDRTNRLAKRTGFVDSISAQDTTELALRRSLRRKTNKLDSIYANPIKAWYSEENLERSVVKADIFNTTISGYSLDSVLLAGKLRNLAVQIGGFYIHAKRDKTLPDPPFEEKPATLAGIIKLPPNVELKTLQVANGNIDVEVVSDVTGQLGAVALNDVWANARLSKLNDGELAIDLIGGGKLYNEGKLDLNYKTLDSERFALKARVSEFNLEKLNAIVLPVQSIDIKSGYLEQFDINIEADNDTARGDATITYKNLHLIFYKKENPEEKNFGTGLLTFIADGLVLKNRKKEAYHPVVQARRKDRVTFQYWTISSINGVLQTIRHGKKEKKFKRKNKRKSKK